MFRLTKKSMYMRSLWINPDTGAVLEVKGKTHEDMLHENIDMFSDYISEEDKQLVKNVESLTIDPTPEDFDRVHNIFENLRNTWIRITYYGNQIGLDVPNKSYSTLHFAQQAIMNEGLKGTVFIRFINGGDIEDVSLDDFLVADKWSDVLKLYRSFRSFALSKRAQLVPVESPNVNVVIEPFDPAVQKAFRALSNTGKVGELKKGVEKIIVHSGGAGHLGHVEMGPGKNPREIHLYKDQIMNEVKKQFGATQPTPIQLQSAIESALMETILHEMYHIGGPQSQGEFRGETETQTAVKQHFPRAASFEEAILKASLDLEEIREKFLPNGSIGEPNLKFMAQSMNQKHYYLVKSGVRLLAKGDSKPAVLEIEEAEIFNKSARADSKTLKILGTITASIGSQSCEGPDFIVALAQWQDAHNLTPTGKLDKETLTHFNKNYGVMSLPRNFGVVVPGKLYRGALIDNIEQLSMLRDKFGIQRIVSLHSSPEIGRMCNKIGLEHVPAPLESGTSDEFGRKILGNSVSKFLLEKPTYIHCWFGKDRTGGVIARFRTETGWPCEAAYREAKAYGFQDIFVDFIDWFSENCDKPPINTDNIRKLFKNTNPYVNPEITSEADSKPDIFKKYDDPVAHVRKDKPTVVLPHNIPDMNVVQEGLERPQEMPITHEGIEKGDPDGPYYLVDLIDNVMERYNTKEQAIKNAENSKWAFRIIYDESNENPQDPIMALVENPEAIVWAKPWEYVRKIESQYPIGPFYLIDYWGRIVMSYDNKDQAIRNAEGNMYISQVNYQPLGDPIKGQKVWEKPPHIEGKEQNAFDPILNPVPNDMPFGNPYADATEHSYTTWSDTINSVSPTGILSIPIPSGSTGV